MRSLMHVITIEQKEIYGLHSSTPWDFEDEWHCLWALFILN